MGNHYRYRFGPFCLDTRGRLMFRDGRQVALKPKAVDTLLLLLRESPRVVEKQSFMDEVWPDACVEDGSLTVSVSEIRRRWVGTPAATITLRRSLGADTVLRRSRSVSFWRVRAGASG